jgi:lipopolysaccharide/colanic/teichoic acid biosynthesis glycosyltransferase
MNGQRITRMILFADLLWLPAALMLSFLLRFGPEGLQEGFAQPIAGSFLLLLMVMWAVWLLLYEPMKLDCFRGGWYPSATASKTMTAVLLQMAIALSWGYATRLYYSRLVLVTFAAIYWAGTLVIRLTILGLLKSRRRRGRATRIMIIGEGQVQRELVERIRLHPELMYEVVGHLHPLQPPLSSAGAPLSGGTTELSTLAVLDLLKKLRVQELFVLLEQVSGLEQQKFLSRCRAEGIQVNVLPQPYQLYLSRPRLIEIDGVPFISLQEPAISAAGVAVKRFMDLFLGIALFIPGAMVTLLAGGILWLKERRFMRRELRCGQGGKQFAMLRLAIETDPSRATVLDRLYRRLSISELPQLWNVLRSEMSFVGPRPESPERARNYTDWQRQRLKFKPGMTGLAQVNGLREEHSSEEKARYDMQYMLHWSPILDIVLILQTLWTLGGRLVTWRSVSVSVSEPVGIPRPRPQEQQDVELQSSGLD